METKNNKQFYEESQNLLERLYARVQMILDDYYDLFVDKKPDIFSSLEVYLLLSSIKREFGNSLKSIEDLLNLYDERFLSGLDK